MLLYFHSHSNCVYPECRRVCAMACCNFLPSFWSVSFCLSPSPVGFVFTDFASSMGYTHIQSPTIQFFCLLQLTAVCFTANIHITRENIPSKKRAHTRFCIPVLLFIIAHALVFHYLSPSICFARR